MEEYDAHSKILNDPLPNGSDDENHLKHKNLQMVNAIYQIPVGVLVSSILDQTVSMVNSALENIIGISAEKMTGKLSFSTRPNKEVFWPGKSNLNFIKYQGANYDCCWRINQCQPESHW